MRMDDNLRLLKREGGLSPAPTLVAEVPPIRRRLRFTSNVVGYLFFVTDIVCFVVSVPITFAAYSATRGQRLDFSVHITAFILTLGSFLLIRMSRHAYRRSLLDLSESSDTTFDAVISTLIASALIWQVGLVDTYSRGVTLLFLLSVVVALSISRPLLHRWITRLSESGQIQQRIAFYGADPTSVALTKQLLETLKFPHLKFVGIADDRARETQISGLPMLGDLPRLCEMARRGEVDQVLISGAKFSPKRLEQIVEGLSEVARQPVGHRTRAHALATADARHEPGGETSGGSGPELARCRCPLAHPDHCGLAGPLHQPRAGPVHSAAGRVQQ